MSKQHLQRSIAGQAMASLFLKGEMFMMKKRKAAIAAMAVAAAVIGMACPAFASATDITRKIDSLYTLVLGIIKAAGAIVLAWGVFEFAAGYQSHDSSQQTQSLKKVISGILMCGASTIIALVK